MCFYCRTQWTWYTEEMGYKDAFIVMYASTRFCITSLGLLLIVHVFVNKVRGSNQGATIHPFNFHNLGIIFLSIFFYWCRQITSRQHHNANSATRNTCAASDCLRLCFPGASWEKLHRRVIQIAQ